MDNQEGKSTYPPPLPLTWDREVSAMFDADGWMIEPLDWRPGQEHEFMERIAGTLNVHDQMRSALADAAAWLWDPDENASEQFERIAEEFYRDTGYLRPGKSEPQEFYTPGREQQRAEAWESWRKERARKVLRAVREALENARKVPA